MDKNPYFSILLGSILAILVFAFVQSPEFLKAQNDRKGLQSLFEDIHEKIRFTRMSIDLSTVDLRRVLEDPPFTEFLYRVEAKEIRLKALKNMEGASMILGDTMRELEVFGQHIFDPDFDIHDATSFQDRMIERLKDVESLIQSIKTSSRYKDVDFYSEHRLFTEETQSFLDDIVSQRNGVRQEFIEMFARFMRTANRSGIPEFSSDQKEAVATGIMPARMIPASNPTSLVQEITSKVPIVTMPPTSNQNIQPSTSERETILIKLIGVEEHVRHNSTEIQYINGKTKKQESIVIEGLFNNVLEFSDLIPQKIKEKVGGPIKMIEGAQLSVVPKEGMAIEVTHRGSWWVLGIGDIGFFSYKIPLLSDEIFTISFPREKTNEKAFEVFKKKIEERFGIFHPRIIYTEETLLKNDFLVVTYREENCSTIVTYYEKSDPTIVKTLTIEGVAHGRSEFKSIVSTRIANDYNRENIDSIEFQKISSLITPPIPPKKEICLPPSNIQIPRKKEIYIYDFTLINDRSDIVKFNAVINHNGRLQLVNLLLDKSTINNFSDVFVYEILEKNFNKNFKDYIITRVKVGDASTYSPIAIKTIYVVDDPRSSSLQMFISLPEGYLDVRHSYISRDQIYDEKGCMILTEKVIQYENRLYAGVNNFKVVFLKTCGGLVSCSKSSTSECLLEDSSAKIENQQPSRAPQEIISIQSTIQTGIVPDKQTEEAVRGGIADQINNLARTWFVSSKAFIKNSEGEYILKRFVDTPGGTPFAAIFIAPQFKDVGLIPRNDKIVAGCVLVREDNPICGIYVAGQVNDIQKNGRLSESGLGSIRHETFHALLNEALSSDLEIPLVAVHDALIIPRWLNEGIASQFDEASRLIEHRENMDVIVDNLFNLISIDFILGLTDDTDSSLKKYDVSKYARGYHFVRFLVEKLGGEKKVYDFLLAHGKNILKLDPLPDTTKGIEQRKAWEDAAQEVYGMSLGDIDQQWKQWLITLYK